MGGMQGETPIISRLRENYSVENEKNFQKIASYFVGEKANALCFPIPFI